MSFFRLWDFLNPYFNLIYFHAYLGFFHIFWKIFTHIELKFSGRIIGICRELKQHFGKKLNNYISR